MRFSYTNPQPPRPYPRPSASYFIAYDRAYPDFPWVPSLIESPQEARKIADWLRRWADWKDAQDGKE